MKNSLILFASITYALKAKKYLERRGVICDIIRTPRFVNGCGCGHSLKLRELDLQRSFDMLERAGYQVVGTYLLEERENDLS